MNEYLLRFFQLVAGFLLDLVGHTPKEYLIRPAQTVFVEIGHVIRIRFINVTITNEVFEQVKVIVPTNVSEI
ncbi:hypothetical protein D3C76_1787600 [compost metagenome]